MSSTPQPSQSRTSPPVDHDAPLTLEDSNEGSTQPVDDVAGTGGSTSSGGGPLSAQSADSAGQGTSTGGFETMLGKLVVQRGLATAEEVELCNALLRESTQSDEPRTLGELLTERAFLTPRQLNRLQSEFEAKKSTGQIPGYKIKRRIGSGAMATVFLARQLSLDRLVAIKVLPKKLSSNANFIDRFYKEGRAAAQLNHPNIVSAYDVGKAGDQHYFVMEFVDGPTVYDRIVKGKRIEEAQAIQVVIQVAKALAHAHERGFIHRDVKPKNIMINGRGAVKLADLGLARAMSDKEAAEAESGRAYGTPYYISPEQIRGSLKIGPPADIYGLGATFYHMVTGKVPFEGKNPSSVMHKHLKAELVPPDHVNPQITAGCGQVIEMMMAKNPRDRYHTVADLLTDLKLISKGHPPHFAHRSLDHSDVLPGLTGEPQPPVKVSKDPGGGSVMDSPAFMIILIIMIVSLLVNCVMLLTALG